MTGQAGLKAGLIGAVVAFLLTIVGVLPAVVPQIAILNCVCCLLPLLAYIGAGVLGGFFLTPPRETGAGAGAGAIAGLLTGVGNTVAWMIVTGVQMLVSGSQQVIDPQTMEAIREIGMNPATFRALSGVTGVFIGGGLCCLFSLAIGAGIGALGGLAFAAAKTE